MTKAEQRKRAVKLTLPVFCGYIVLGIAFGATLAQAGYGPVWALAISTLVYAGSLQFVMVPFLAGGTSLIAVMILAIPGVVEQALLGNINYAAGIAIAVGSIPGAVIGARLVRVVPELALRFVFGFFLIVAAVILVLNEFGILG